MAHDLGRQAPVLGDKPAQLLDQAAAAPAVDGLEELAEQLPLVVVEEFVAAGRRGVLEVKVLSVAEVDWCRRTGSAGGVLQTGKGILYAHPNATTRWGGAILCWGGAILSPAHATAAPNAAEGERRGISAVAQSAAMKKADTPVERRRIGG